MISPERLDGLQKQWVHLLSGYGVSPAEAYPPFDRLVDVYSQPHRHYHTLEHIAEMLKLACRLGKLAENPTALTLAIWYHDAIYDPKSHQNEQLSAVLAGEELTALGIPATRVQELIQATDHRTEPTTPDSVILIDIDLAILGASETRYDRYAADVRKEYAFVAEEDYRQARRKVLQSFLDRPRIYRTPLLFEEGEVSAQANLLREIDRLAHS